MGWQFLLYLCSLMCLLLSFSPPSHTTKLLCLQKRWSSLQKHQITCTYTLHLTFAGRSADVHWISYVLRTMFKANTNKLSSSPKLVLETWASLEKPVGESRLLSSEPFISSAGAFKYSPDELSWQITYDPRAMACWCLMQSRRWFKMISHTQVLYINKIQNLNQHKHTKMHWIRRKMWNLIKWEDTARAGLRTKYSINSHKKILIILYSCWN